jgi:hypothetical protein
VVVVQAPPQVVVQPQVVQAVPQQVVVRPATPVVVSGGVATTGVITGTARPVTQTFTPPQEIVLSAAPTPTQTFTPPTRTVIRTVTQPVTVVRTVSRPVTTQVFTPPSTTSALPFTGVPVALGLIAGIGLIASGTLLLVRRRAGLERTLAAQSAALRRL